MNRKQPKTKKTKTELAFEKSVMENILDGGSLKDIIKLIKSNFKNDWKNFLLKKVWFNQRFLDWDFNILQLAVYFVNIPILEELYQDSKIFETLINLEKKQDENMDKTRAQDFEKVLIIFFKL